MSLVKYNTSPVFFPKRFNSIFDSFFDDQYTKSSENGLFKPSVDISETENNYQIDAALPGVSKKDIKIDLKDNYLTISGERKSENEEEGKNYHRIETVYGSFQRSFQLPEDVNEESIEASFDNGLLKVTIKKQEKKELTKTIKIK